MDLTFTIDNKKLNIRVSIILKAPSGYIFEFDEKGFYFPIGGRIKLGENSIEAARREIKEEIGCEIDDIEYISTIENFFKYEDSDFHEINFVHKAKIYKDPKLPYGFIFIKKHEIDSKIIKPEIITNIIKMEKPHHYIVN